MRMYELLTAEQALNKLGSAALPDVKKTLAIVKLLKAVREHVENYNTVKKTYLGEYGEDQGNGSFFIPAENRAKFEKLMVELGDEEVELSAVDLNEADIATAGLSANDLLALGPTISFDID